jgi:DNA-binding NarL/FixJ family response regulator
MNRPRILLADDHTMVLDAFRKLLEPSYQVVGTARDGRELLDAAVKMRPDVIVADISMPRLNGLDACERLRGMLPATKLIVLTQHEDPDVAADAIRRGANGYLLKKSAASELFEAIQKVLQGRTFVTSFVSGGVTSLFVSRAKSGESRQTLSLRKREVLQLLAEGKSMKEAADALHVTPRTIAFHKYSMMEQMGFKTTAELLQYAMQLGLVTAQSRDSGSADGRPRPQ